MVNARSSMIIGSLLLLLELSSALVHKKKTQYDLCKAGNPPTSLYSLGSNLSPSEVAKIAPRSNIPVDVVFHIVHQDFTTAGGYMPTQQVDDQFDLLQSSIATLDVDLTLVAVRRHHIPTFFTGGPDITNTAALREGDYKTLNVYFVGGGIGGGTASFPEEFPDTYTQSIDAVFVHYTTVPGGGGSGWPSRWGWNLGKTLVHETGHWLGLFHTFQGFCDPDPINGGDLVADTPASGWQVYGCPDDEDYEDWDEGDSCIPPEHPPNEPDPHWNPMAYWDDRCKEDVFTPGQKARVHMVWALTRGKF